MYVLYIHICISIYNNTGVDPKSMINCMHSKASPYHWSGITGAGSLEIRNFEGEQAPPDSHAGSLELDHCGSIGAGSLLFTVSPLTWSGIIAIYSDPASLERDHWRSVTLRANRHHLTAMRDHWGGIIGDP